MGLEEYREAYKAGKKDYNARMMQGKRPTLPVLDEILPPKGSYSEKPLGLVQIPSEQIVGTKTGGRSTSFAGNFMPILRETSEFAAKWSALSTSHVEEGIREPIKAYEYMNQFYVQEGNKRVSVMKFFGVVSIPGEVTRIIPQRTEEKQNKIYYEFMDFYDLTEINYIYFSETGGFKKLQKAVGKEPDEVWTKEERLTFSSVYSRFLAEYDAKGGQKLDILPGDAFLAFLKIYDYNTLDQITTNELKQLVAKSWEEFELLTKDKEVDLKMDPTTEKAPILTKLFSIASLSTQKQKIAFLYEKTPGTSSWTYTHELGRLHLEEAFSDEVSTMYYENVTPENAEEKIEDAISKGCNLVFTTTPTFVQASVKSAIAHPDVRILNCSLNTTHRYIRTYYSRMHEAKFLMGAIAGAMAENDRLMYVADYPIYGAIANINAFALGAKMVNPRAKVYLEWSTKKDLDLWQRVQELAPACVSARDMVIPEEGSRFFGIFHKDGEEMYSLAMPVWNWGAFYERLIRTIMDGTWKYDDSGEVKAINYWWGMSAGVVDVICSQNLPVGTKRLVSLLKNTIISGGFNPFEGVLYSQNGVVQGDPNRVLTPEEIMSMDWLAENIIGAIPKKDELEDHAKPVIIQQGVLEKEG